jgi:hypothetical protein
MTQEFKNVRYTDRPRLHGRFQPRYHRYKGTLEISLTDLKFTNSIREKIPLSAIDNISLEKPPQIWVFSLLGGLYFIVGYSAAAILLNSRIELNEILIGCFAYAGITWKFRYSKLRWIVISPSRVQKHYYFWVSEQKGIQKTQRLFEEILQARRDSQIVSRNDT